MKKEISNSEKLGAVKTDRARVLYLMMLPHLDVVGRLEANTRLIKGQIVTMLPYSQKAIQTSLEQLREVHTAIATALKRKDVNADHSIFRITLKSDINSEDKGTVEYEIYFDDPIIKIAEGHADTA